MKHFLTVLMVLNALLLPCGCLRVMFIALPAAQVMPGFITDIHITNATQYPIKITPIGTMGSNGYRSPLHQIHRTKPTFDAKTRGGIAIQPNATAELFYDWDDINFSEIVIEDHTGQFTQLVVDPSPTQNQYRPPAVNTFTIDDQTVLTPVPPVVFAAYQAALSPPSTWRMTLLFFIPWVTFSLFLGARFRRPIPRSSTGG